MQQPTLDFSFFTAVPDTYMAPMRGNDVIPFLTDRVDLKAPGVRDQLNDVNMPQLGPFMPATFYPQRVNNNAPILNMDQRVPDFLFNEPWAQARGAYLWKVCHDTKDLLHPSFQERGSFNVPYTGFSAFADLAPRSTLKWI